MSTLRPETPDDVVDAIRWALAGEHPLRLTGNGTAREFGGPVEGDHELDLSALTGVVSYEPGELVLTARAGTPLHEIHSLLAASRQQLAFEAPELGALFGTGTRATLGGAVALGFSGPRRLRAGAARDHVLGVSAVSGRAEAFKGGGKVVKNVTGYDLPKLLTGSFGTLAVLTEITLKVLPAPEDTRTLLLPGLDAHEAVTAMTEALQSPADVSGACYIPRELSVPGKPADESVTALRLEGFRPSVEFRLARLRERLHRVGAHVLLDADESLAFWQAVRDVHPLAGSTGILWRISVPPAQGGAVLLALQQALPGSQALIDWGGGLIWLLLPDEAEARCEDVRRTLQEYGGHATLFRAPAAVRAASAVFHPQPPALAALTKRVKEQFDPAQILNRGLMRQEG